MKKIYICPDLKIDEAQASQMLAESLSISDKNVNGKVALTKEDNGWDIWGEE